MKTIGIIGGMSWESTASYYKLINQSVKREKGGLHSAKLILNSVDFAEIEALQHKGDWDKTAVILSEAAQSLEKAGADFLIIATNTMHKVASQVEAAVSIPLLHIADATGQRLVEQGISTVGLLGTAFTMEQAFYKQRLTDKFGIDVIVPNGVQRRLVHDVIYDELCLGDVNARSKQDFKTIIEDLSTEGAQGVILGCTEIGLLISEQDTDIPLFDTTEIHAYVAVNEALK
ncbi:aspartate/glutamate racemase family protein [Vibrio neptunius]|uniref:Aspartate/glutamate racemase family protein n=1 Tax=Vibrio neptunius TaxID=170651 RepID=A0ABS2ZZQ1_9VIBR|nr:aspartate/glutamate racemase family protein [Vibrio neptunius]MBN3492351.1 aspartate/glutamate racemase family protein [Vibrio neptunius]MBN3514834.1 aspartate/glutamate racemase family protein [Vibrio neptunius]MBN3549731.1 aspartate/glutamate racemase family protein [Vibrio neptunius]MBN3576976.1 aspartate/glutamate racemase family protein [Vibrio neptunius]MCH9870640.1 aspartate/glutamate racemase family protein [Vibrio neptunius]